MAPLRKELVIPVAISQKSRIFLTPRLAEKFERDRSFWEEHYLHPGSLTLPSGIVLNSQGARGKFDEMVRQYVTKSGLFLKHFPKAAYIRSQALNAALSKRGLPVEKFLYTFPEKDEKGRKLIAVVVPKKYVPLALAFERGRFTKKDFRGMCRALSALHAEGYSHEHPHLGNFFRDPATGRVGIHDFSRVEKRNVDWSRPESIIEAFGDDYAYALGLLSDIPEFHRDKVKWADKMPKIRSLINPLTHHLPATSKVRRAVIDHFIQDWET